MTIGSLLRRDLRDQIADRLAKLTDEQRLLLAIVLEISELLMRTRIPEKVIRGDVVVARKFKDAHQRRLPRSVDPDPR